MKIFGVDFSSSPSRRKPIVIASAELSNPATQDDAWSLILTGFENMYSLDEFAQWLNLPGPWVAGFDFPFALPKELLIALGWPPFSYRSMTTALWTTHIEHLASLSRAELVAAFKGFCAARPAGGKFAHRACDRPAGASPSMKWVNPPVAYMLHAGATRLHQAGLMIPGLKPGDAERVALEAYPGYLARLVLGRESYKSDNPLKQNVARRQARLRLLESLGAHTLSEIGMARAIGLKLSLHADIVATSLCADDASGDHLDAWLCAIQASVGHLWEVREPGSCYGMGAIDPLEGWIVGVMRD